MAWKSSTHSRGNRWAPPSDAVTEREDFNDLSTLQHEHSHCASSAALVIASSCALTTTPALAQAGKIEKPDITFGVFPITNYGVVYLSIQQGFFKEEGLNVTPRVMGANPIAGIVGGDFDTGGVTWTAFLLATNRGIPLVPLSEADRGSKGQALFMVKDDSPIKTTEDLVGQEDRCRHRRRRVRPHPQ